MVNGRHGSAAGTGRRADLAARSADAPVALITGGARKLGASMSLHLARAGYRMVIDYRRSREEAEALVRRIRQDGGAAVGVRADVTRAPDVRRMFDRVQRTFGRLDVLVNNVGDYLEKPLGNVQLPEWERILRSNLDSVFLCTRAALPLMRSRGWGRVINIGYAPVGKGISSPRCPVYHLAKLGALSLTKVFAQEEAPHGITVNMISPGTLFNSVKKPSLDPRDYIPAGRFCRFGDVHGALDYLLSEAGDYVTGGHVLVSGGYAL